MRYGSAYGADWSAEAEAAEAGQHQQHLNKTMLGNCTLEELDQMDHLNTLLEDGDDLQDAETQPAELNNTAALDEAEDEFMAEEEEEEEVEEDLEEEEEEEVQQALFNQVTAGDAGEDEEDEDEDDEDMPDDVPPGSFCGGAANVAPAIPPPAPPQRPTTPAAASRSAVPVVAPQKKKAAVGPALVQTQPVPVSSKVAPQQSPAPVGGTSKSSGSQSAQPAVGQFGQQAVVQASSPASPKQPTVNGLDPNLVQAMMDMLMQWQKNQGLPAIPTTPKTPPPRAKVVTPLLTPEV